MIPQVINITGIQLSSIRPSDAEALPKLLPAENSLVEVSVLDKPQGGSYKLLIEGNVFQSKLPISINIGETLIAKVIGLNPFTLSLDNIFTAKMLSGSNIALVLSKLGLSESEVSLKVVKAFLKEDKPLVKSKLKKIIDLLEKENIKLDDEQLSLFIQMLHMDEAGGSRLKKSFARMFEYPVSTLAGEVFNSVKRLNTMGLGDEAVSQINRALVMEIPEEGSPSAMELKEKISVRLEEVLKPFAEVEAPSGGDSLKREIFILKEALLRYNMLRACHEKTGIYPGFIIVKSEGDLELVEFRLESDTKEQSQNFHRIKLEMNPRSLGKITMSGFLSGQNFSATFSAKDETAEELEDGKQDLLDALGRLNLLPRLSFGEVSGREAVSNTGMRQINVRV
ncbi:MAG TPA: flagellar hook-length control protein FliK [Ignavibacteriales bacterium]|nr:flagellar hook-length control protein FliK [Ignavibacteriales bacterium]